MRTKFKTQIGAAIIPVIISFLLLGFNGCKEDSVQPANSDNLDFSVKSTSGSAATGTVLLEIEECKMLVKDIKLNVASSNENMVNYKTGPYVLYFDFTSNVSVVTTGGIAAGTYDWVRFEIHKLQDNEAILDPDFADAMGRYSIVVKGKSNGVSFTFKSSMSSHQKLTFPGSLVVTSSGRSNITLHAQPYLWFMDKGVYLDPAIEINKTAIELNIKNNINSNIRIFVDNDRNGQPD
jgi:hypothetical protein